jgi:dUTP pyrophosphatase
MEESPLERTLELPERTNMVVKIKKLVEHAEIPSYAKDGDAGLDLVATDVCHNREYDFVEYGTGLAFEIPEGYVGLIFPRSSISKTPHMLCNSVGVVDAGYRGEVKFRFKGISGKEDMEYEVGDKVGQLIIMPFPKVTIKEVETLESSERGVGGFGSTGV